MIEETENLVLIHLREVRAKLEGFDTRFGGVEARLDKMDKDFETLRFQLTHTFGMANTQALRADEKADARSRCTIGPTSG
jgi:DNA anti-recombination protein RmuC